MIASTPEAEVEIDAEGVRVLLREQHPDLANASVELIDSGWDNLMYRLGEHFVVRLPRRTQAVPLARNEQRWLPELAGRLPLPIPSPLRVGRASASYPWPWSILPYLPGETADLESPASTEAEPLADFLLALHRPAPSDAPVNEVRGVPLAQRAAKVEERLERLSETTERITPTVQTLWRQALSAPLAKESLWLHGDLHARNVLVESGKISGIIDWGDVTSGDVATDLACIWMLLAEADARASALEHYRPSSDLLARAKGWGIFFGAVLLDTGLIDHPRHAAMGEATLRRLDADG